MEPEDNLKQYADGWITERKGTEVPGFLKYAFGVIALGCLAYMLIYMHGEVSHADRGRLVQQMNAATESSSALMYTVVALMAAFAVIVVTFAWRKFHED